MNRKAMRSLYGGGGNRFALFNQGLEAQIPAPTREGGFEHGRNVESPDSEQIEHNIAEQFMRNSVSVEQIQDRTKGRGQHLRVENNLEDKFVSESKRAYKFKRGVKNTSRAVVPAPPLNSHCERSVAIPSKIMRLLRCSATRNDNKKLIKKILPRPLGERVRVRGKIAAFTLAEVLITLGIIGVVAAMTLPSVIQSYQKQVTVNKLKKAYSVLGQVAQQGVSENAPAEIIAGNSVDANTTKEFFENYWLKYFKGVEIYNKTFDLNNGKPQYKYYNGELYDTNICTIYSAGRIFFATADNMTFFIIIMGWINTKYDDEGNVTSQDAVYKSAQTVYVDINGLNPPNTFGKDVFWFNVDFENGTVRPAGYASKNIDTNCTKNGAGSLCAAKIMRDGWKITYPY